MVTLNKGFRVLIYLFIFLAMVDTGSAQETLKKKNKGEKPPPHGTPVMWQKIDISQQDLLLGPGGEEMKPDLSNITFVETEKGGSSKKYKIKDAAGRTWVAKIDQESQPEVVAVRLLAAIGYKTEINYLAPQITIPGKGTFTDVRLEARPKDIKRLDRWKWEDNPFNNTRELQGLKIMMAFLDNWDVKDGNTVILQKGDEPEYVISDLGASFGKPGDNNLPIFWRFGRSINKPSDYVENDFIKSIDKGDIAFSFKGKGSKLFDNISVEDGRWLADLLLQLSDEQLAAAFRAADYSMDDVNRLRIAVKDRIAALDRATRNVKS